MSQKLVFVYNSTSGAKQAAFDLLHKTVRPETYQCKLCSVTYSGAIKKRAWRDFLDQLPIEHVFYYTDTFKAAFPSQLVHAPAVFLQQDDNLTLLVSPNDFDKINTLTELKTQLNEQLKLRIKSPRPGEK
ncbi:MAG: hypothetical protein U5L95_04705 [Candidatus Saccharibacteria bacterium]|nr:hypothetical protein [Candidatus Saccharibacteria bacterium]